jgi:Tat protein secretion system quality control protein TatD with DNase activity
LEALAMTKPFAWQLENRKNSQNKDKEQGLWAKAKKKLIQALLVTTSKPSHGPTVVSTASTTQQHRSSYGIHCKEPPFQANDSLCIRAIQMQANRSMQGIESLY